MDVSKLPKLSDSRTAAVESVPADPAPPLPSEAVVPTPVSPVTPRLAPVGIAETWMSIGVGAFVLLFWPRFLQWASSRVFHTHFDEFLDNVTGAVVPYQTLPEFWSDLGPTLLGITLVVDGLLLFTRRPGLIAIAMGLTLVSTLFNLGWLVYSFGTYGVAPLSFLAVIFGGFILFTQWASFKTVRLARRGIAA